MCCPRNPRMCLPPGSTIYITTFAAWGAKLGALPVALDFRSRDRRPILTSPHANLSSPVPVRPSLFLSFASILVFTIMSAPGGTFRGTPNKTIGRGKMPDFEQSPSSSHIPRPKAESATTSHGMSDVGSNATTASRQRQNQSKRDEVCAGFTSIFPD
jgi:hypothetical protein